MVTGLTKDYNGLKLQGQQILAVVTFYARARGIHEISGILGSSLCFYSITGSTALAI